MSVNEEQIDWSECPIGRRCTNDMERMAKENAHSHREIREQLSNVQHTTDRLSGKLTIVIGIVLAAIGTAFSLLADLFKQLLHIHGG